MAELAIEFSGPREEMDAFLETLFETDSVEMGTDKEILGGGKLTMGGVMMRKSVGAPHAVEVMLTIAGSVAVNIASSYIYDKLKSHKGDKPKMIIEYREIHIDKGEITKIIEEEVKLLDDDD
jgi:hypothetical protein